MTHGIEDMSLLCPDRRRAYLFALWSFGEPQRARQEFCALQAADGAKEMFALDAGREVLKTLRQESLRSQAIDPSIDLGAILGRYLNVKSMRAAKSRKVEKLIALLIAQSRALRDVIILSRIFDFTCAQTAAVLRLPVGRTEAIERLGTERLRHEFSQAITVKAGRAALYPWRNSQQFDQTLASLRCLVQRFIYATSTATGRFKEHFSQRVRSVLPMMGLVAWFLLPVALVAGVSEALVAVEIHFSRDWSDVI